MIGDYMALGAFVVMVGILFGLSCLLTIGAVLGIRDRIRARRARRGARPLAFVHNSRAAVSEDGVVVHFKRREPPDDRT